jgi:hypothetical protein
MTQDKAVSIVDKVFESHIDSLRRTLSIHPDKSLQELIPARLENIKQELISEVNKIEMHNSWYNWDGASYDEQVKEILIGRDNIRHIKEASS